MTVVALSSHESAFARDLHRELADDDVQMATIDPGTAGRDAIRQALGRAGADAVVYVCADALAVEGTPLSDTGPDEWDRRGERLLREALATFQAAHDHFAARAGGRLVLVTSTAGISGAPSLVPLLTAVEGVRAMAKSAARQWGQQGVTVNAVLLPLEVLEPSAAGATSFLTPPALGAPSTVRDVAAAIRWLAGPDGTGITGATVVADGGAVMAP